MHLPVEIFTKACYCLIMNFIVPIKESKESVHWAGCQAGSLLVPGWKFGLGDALLVQLDVQAFISLILVAGGHLSQT